MPLKKVSIKEWEELGLPKETTFINFGQNIDTFKKKNKIIKKNQLLKTQKNKKY